ncbi:MAG: chlorite dismutase family protein, partial [Terriglobales bacterium]
MGRRVPTTKAAAAVAQGRLPALPLTIEGSSVLHQMMRVRWPAWRKFSAEQKQEMAKEAAGALGPMEEAGESALYSMLGHKGDLMFVHFRDSFDALNATELRLQSLELFDYLEPATSYLSVIELGLYESTVKL